MGFFGLRYETKSGQARLAKKDPRPVQQFCFRAISSLERFLALVDGMSKGQGRLRGVVGETQWDGLGVVSTLPHPLTRTGMMDLGWGATAYTGIRKHHHAA
jgi:hypothetical protein